MRCQACTQPLWNAPGRVCAECGTPWKPSDFDLKVNAAQFCCPACGQAYYGTSPKGLLEPPDFTCVTCGAACSMDGNMVMRPTPGTDEREVQWDAMAWPPQGGRWLRDSIRMLGLAIGSPVAVGRHLRAHRDTGVLRWLVVLSIPITIGVMGTLAFAGLGALAGRSGAALRASEMTEFAIVAAAGLLGPFLALLALTAFCGGVTWLVVRGGDEKASFSAAQSCWAFGASPLAIMVVPCLGIFPGAPVGLAGTVVLATLMIHSTYVAGTARKLLAALLPPALILVGLIGYAVLAAVMRPTPPPPPAPFGATGGAPAFDGRGMILTQPAETESP